MRGAGPETSDTLRQFKLLELGLWASDLEELEELERLEGLEGKGKKK